MVERERAYAGIVHRGADRRIPEPVAYRGRWQSEAVRRIRASSRGLGERYHGVLRDIERGRYAVLDALVDICARCEDDGGAYALVELLTVEIAARRAQADLPLADLILAETAAQGPADLAEAAVLRDPRDRTKVAALREAAGTHLRRLWALLEAAR